jgi:rhodanese-related sulfurtransferase
LENYIDPEELNDRLHSENPPLVIDVRPLDSYSNGHIEHALNIPQDNLLKSNYINNDRLIVTYCNFQTPGNSGSEHAATLLNDNGFDAVALRGGFPAWREAGLPVEKGNNPTPV